MKTLISKECNVPILVYKFVFNNQILPVMCQILQRFSCCEVMHKCCQILILRDYLLFIVGEGRYLGFSWPGFLKKKQMSNLPENQCYIPIS